MENVKDNSTKISISKDLHKLIKRICVDNGLKMQFFEDKAVEDYIKINYPNYIKKS